MLTILTGRDAAEFARKYNPVVVQYTTGNDPRDNIEPFYSGPFDGCKQPVAYYAVKRDDLRRYNIAYYHWFHRLDWGGKGDVLGGNVDKHPGDFEGCCFCIPDDDKESSYILTRCHHHILRYFAGTLGTPDPISLESKGHGCTYEDYDLIDAFRTYPSLPLIPLYSESGDYSSVAKLMRLQFARWGTVQWMDEYTDQRLTAHAVGHVGDYWNDPLGLVAKMEGFHH